MEIMALVARKENLRSAKSASAKASNALDGAWVESKIWAHKKLYGVIFLCLSIIVVGYLVYIAFKFSHPPQNLDEIAVIRADLTPVKTVPTDPGGAHISNQDKLIYHNLQDPTSKQRNQAALESEVTSHHDVVLRSPPVQKKPPQKAEKAPRDKVQATISNKSNSKVSEAKKPAVKAVSNKKNTAAANPFDFMESEE